MHTSKHLYIHPDKVCLNLNAKHTQNNFNYGRIILPGGGGPPMRGGRIPIGIIIGGPIGGPGMPGRIPVVI